METKLKSILTQLRRQMNGAVSQTMRELGQGNVMNLGVSLPTIKDIALGYAPNHELANELSTRKMREAQIVALYVAQPDMLTYTQMEQWSRNWENEEIARLSAMVLFHKSPDAEQIASEWLSTESPQSTSEETETGSSKSRSEYLNLKHLRNISAIYIIGKQASKIDKDVIKAMLDAESNHQTEAATYCLREIFFAREEFRDHVRVLAKNNPELSWQIADIH